MLGFQSKLIFVFVCVLSTVNYSDERSEPDSPDYVAAVVEYAPLNNPFNTAHNFMLNSEVYVELIRNASNYDPKNADIIVFPALGLESLYSGFYTVIPPPSASMVPCVDTSGTYEYLRNISCAARDNEIYVVINLSEFTLCQSGVDEYDQPCPSAILKYNTNIVFDRKGALIQKYRTYNQYYDGIRGDIPGTKLATFKTDFDVTFGMFASVDLLLWDPAVRLVKEARVTDIVHPTLWRGETPFMTGVQALAQWAYSLDVNLLAASYSLPERGRCGSGVFSGKLGPLDYFTSTEETTKLIVSSVPKKKIVRSKPLLEADDDKLTPVVDKDLAEKPIMPSEDVALMSALKDNSGALQKYARTVYLRESDLETFSSHVLTPSSSEEETTLCHREFCCIFTVNGNQSDDGNQNFYTLLAFDGVRAPAYETTDLSVGLQICAVVACRSKSLLFCGGDLFGERTTLKKISIKATFYNYLSLQFPSTLLENYKIIPASAFSLQCIGVEPSSEHANCEMSLNVETTGIQTFGIFNRVYLRDGDEITETLPGGAAAILALSALIVGGVITGLCF